MTEKEKRKQSELLAKEILRLLADRRRRLEEKENQKIQSFRRQYLRKLRR